MAGYARQQAIRQNHLVGYRSRGTVSGYNLGMYGTWQQDEKAGLGGYMDSWFDGSVKGDEIAGEKYRLRGMKASVETGYTLPAGKIKEHLQVFVRP